MWTPPRMETMLENLFPHAEKKHGLSDDPAGRFLAGLSMGGYGALRLTIQHPRRFRAAASLSGAIFPDLFSANAVTKGQIRMFKGAFGKPLAPNIYNRLKLFVFVGDYAGFRLYEGAVNLYLPLKRLRIPM